MIARVALTCLLLTLSACQQPPRDQANVTLATLPADLRAWNVFEMDAGRLTLTHEFVPYDLNSPLFSDYSHKLRAIRVPAGKSIRYGEEDFQFPIGTVIAKTFYYPHVEGENAAVVLKVLQQAESDSLDLHSVRLVETRLLINTAEGWVVAPYVWNEEQTAAHLELAGDSVTLELVNGDVRQPFEYVVPDANQCAGCHAADHQHQILKPIGIKARHLNRDFRYASGPQNQLKFWTAQALLTGAPAPERAPRNAQWDQPGDLNARARAYLDANCAHCHSPLAAANTSGLFLDAHQEEPTRWGVCKIPVASGRGSGSAAYDIVPGDPDESILLYRMTSTEPDIAMPELGRSLVHDEGVALIREWISSLSDECETAESH